MKDQNIEKAEFEVNPEIMSATNAAELEILKNIVNNPQEPVSEENAKVVLSLIDKAAEVFGDDLVKETLAYLAAARHGLRIEDLTTLLGESWDNVAFSKVSTCFGVPIVVTYNNMLLIPSFQLKEIIFSSLGESDRKSFHADLAHRFIELPANDPLNVTEPLFHLIRSGNVEKAANFYAATQGQQLANSADAIGINYVVGGETADTVMAMLDVENVDRFELYRRFINEVFISLSQKAAPEFSEKMMIEIENRLAGILNGEAKIEEIILLSMAGLRMVDVKLRSKEMEEVKKYFDRSLGIIDHLFKMDPQPAAFTWTNCDGLFNIALICLDLRQPKAASHILDKAFDVVTAKVNEAPAEENRKIYLASWYIRICRIFQQVNEKEECLKFFNRGKDLLKEVIKDKAEQASKDSENINIQRDLMVMYNDYGDLAHLNGYKEEAEAAYENSLVISERMADKNPDNVEIAIAPTVVYDRLGKMYSDLKDKDKGQVNFVKSMDIRKNLSYKYPEDLRLKHDLASAYHNLANFFITFKSMDQAESYIVKQNSILKEVYKKAPQEQNLIAYIDSTIGMGDFYFSQNSADNAIVTFGTILNDLKELFGQQVSEPVLGRIAAIHYKMGVAQLNKNEKEKSTQNIKVSIDLWNQLYKATNNSNYKISMDKATAVLNGNTKAN